MSTQVTPAASLDELRPTFRQRLKSMYAREAQPGRDGPVEIDELTRISEQQGLWIYETCRRLKPKRSLEIGLAYGFSTVFILAAIDQLRAGHHTAIDPFQWTDWRGVGALQAKHLDMEQSFELLEEFSSTALARFATRKDEFEFIYIDGGHRFDDVLVDFTLAAQVCPIGGQIILDDMWMPSIQTVASWIRHDRPDFREIPTPTRNIAQFERVAIDNRTWRHFVQFFPVDEALAKRPLVRRIAGRIKRILAGHTAQLPG